MWIYVDNAWRILSYNPNDMDGNTGWYETHDPLFDPQKDAPGSLEDQAEQAPKINVELYDHRGIPLYRYDLDTDTIIQRAQTEMDADYIPPVHVPDPTERIAALESAMTAIEEGIASV